MAYLISVARDFTYTYEGQTLTYTVIDEESKTCATKSGELESDEVVSGNIINGDLILPTTVYDEEVAYTLKSIGEYAFFGQQVTSVVIPNSVTTIGESSFSYCQSLNSVTFGNSVKIIDRAAFEDCISLTSLEIPNSVEVIDTLAFRRCKSLKSLLLPNSLKNIGVYAFSNCSSLTSLKIPDAIETIADWAFSGCTSLTSIELPNSVKTIGYGTFYECTGLTSLKIPNSVTTIGYYAFSSCKNLKNLVIADGEEILDISSFAFKDVEISEIYYGRPWSLYGLGNFTKVPSCTLTVGPLVKHIGSFGNCTWLKSIKIPNSVTSIGDTAFCECTGLSNVELPDSLTNIGIFVFAYCTGLTSIKIPDSVTRIEEYAFRGCTSLTSIEIPNSVTLIEQFVFESCTSLASVSIGSSVKNIHHGAFIDCPNLNKVEFSSIESLCNINFGDTFSNPLYYAQNLWIKGDEIRDLEIPKTVSTIGRYTFYGCSGLTSVMIPESVEEIGTQAFGGCDGLENVYYSAATPINTANSDIFSTTAYRNAALWIPEEAEELCKQIEPWCNFSNIKPYNFTTGIKESAEEIYEDDEYEVYDLSGIKIGNSTTQLERGVYIVRQGNKTKKIVISNSQI